MTTVVTESNQNMASNDTEAQQPKTDEKIESANEEKVDQNEEKNAQTGPASPTKKPTVHKADFEKDVVYVYQFTRCPALASVSPFCLKVETWLRMCGVKFENMNHKMKYKSKKGQLPFVELNGQEIADSEIIINKLSTYFGKNLDETLTPDQRNVSHAFESMLDNHTSWVVRCWRVKNPGEFLKMSKIDIKKTLNSKLPKVVLNVLFKFGLKSHKQQTIGHGLGRHSMEEIVEFGKKDLKALSEQLGDKEFFFGAEPHLLDCVAFAHLCQFIYIPFAGFEDWINQNVPNLKKFVEKMQAKYWPDWEELCKTLDMNTHIPKTEAEKEEAKKKEEAKEQEKKKKKEKEEKKKEKEEKKRKEKEEKEKKKKEKEAKEKAEQDKKTDESEKTEESNKTSVEAGDSEKLDTKEDAKGEEPKTDGSEEKKD